jgi:tetratricopeptide (TPR) repeat protein
MKNMGVIMKFIASFFLAVTLCAPGALAAGGGAWDSAAKTAIDAKDWAGAIKLLESEVADNKATADTYNYLGFAYRGLGHYEQAFKHYATALRMDPEHRGAHEYVGETYLVVGNLKKAKEHLAALDRICFFGCDEFYDLKAAIAAYRPK